MNILISGAGKVGYNLAKSLSKNHNVIIIDNNITALEKLQESLDVMTLYGSSIEYKTFIDFKQKFDFFIAVTDNDEINLISTILIDNLNLSNKNIVRLTKNSYITTSNHLNNLNIDRYIFPNQLSALTISKLIKLPQAITIKEFPFSEFILVSVFAKNSQIQTTNEIDSNDSIVIGIERDTKFEFIQNNTKLQEGDLIYILGKKENIKHLIKKIDTQTPQEIENVLIYSASDLGIEIANTLFKLGLNIKILEKDEKIAKKAANKLYEDITIINSAYDDKDMFINEGLQYSDIAITASLKDEENITKSLQAKEFGIKKIITINNNLNYYSIAHSLKLATIRGPKIASYYEILESIDSNSLIYERFFLGSKGIIFIKKILTPKKISPPKEYTKTIILRDNNIINLQDSFETKENDIIMKFNFSGNKKWIEQV